MDFTWRDGERVIRFGRGAIADAPGLLGEDYILLTTPRARGAAPEVVAGARLVLDVGPGFVDELAAALLDDVGAADAPLVCALGGGRVVDTAKAVATATGRDAAAIPTTLSAAEMTWLHRQAAGVDPPPPPLRPRLVINDPALSASQPLPELAASAGNSLAHAIEGPLTPLASPVPVLAAREAVRLTDAGWPEDGAPDRDKLALAAVLSGYTIDATWYGLHHVMSQTLVRLGGAAHGPANAALLPHTARALQARFPDAVSDADLALAERLARATLMPRLRDQGVSAEALDRCADAAARRPELGHTPPAPDRDALRAIYEEAW